MTHLNNDVYVWDTLLLQYPGLSPVHSLVLHVLGCTETGSSVERTQNLCSLLTFFFLKARHLQTSLLLPVAGNTWFRTTFPPGHGVLVLFDARLLTEALPLALKIRECALAVFVIQAPYTVPVTEQEPDTFSGYEYIG